MRIFVAGGTGVVGRHAIPALVTQGHEVSAVARSSEKATLARALGARPVELSLFDAEALRAAVAGHDVVINLATSIPPLSRAAWKHAWRMNDRLRREGSRNLVEAALTSGASRFVQESVAFVYADGDEEWITEDHAVKPSSITASAMDAEAEARRFQASGGTAAILRFGSFYGSDSGHTADVLRIARLGFGATPGPRDAYVSSISTDDAATAVVAAATEAPSGTYNVVDDDPVTRRDLDEILARVVGREKLRPMPSLVVRLLGDKLEHVMRSQRVSNRSLRTATGWQPRYPTVREGLPAVAAAMDSAIASTEQPQALAP